MRRALLLLAGAFILPACTTSNVQTEWNCGPVEGIGCRSIAEIQSTIVRSGDAPTPMMIGQTRPLEVQGMPLWQPDQIMKIHVADFVDSSNNYHGEGVIYTVVRRAGWARE